MPFIINVFQDITKLLGQLKAAGITYIIRYDASHRITRSLTA